MSGQWSLPIPTRRFFSKVNELFDPFDGVNHAVYLSWIERLGLDYNENGEIMGSVGHIRGHYGQYMTRLFVSARQRVHGPNLES